jgi:single-stranded-DNA-specific exonuclease
MRAHWDIAAPPDQAYLNALSDLHPLTASTLFARGFAEPAAARDFLSGKFDPVDPFAMLDMRRAVERIAAAIAAQERIAVYGDYDCDGVCACALLETTLASLGADVHVYIPNRFEEGYGINGEALELLKSEGTALVISVDCGARALREARLAREIGLDLIITDHHEPDPNAMPAALAFVNPRRADCPYAFKSLAGVGVAFRLAQCLLRSIKVPGAISERSLLDFVAIGTVADLVSLRGENRLLVRAGLDLINTKARTGIAALIRSAGIAAGTVDAGKIGFMLGPRLNAAGRLESALAAYELLVSKDTGVADDLAAQLNSQNEMRQQVTAEVALAAELRAFDGDTEPAVLFAADESFNAGVIGLAAARLVEKHYRPSVVVSIHNGQARGSCRSVHGFHITRALDACAELLIKHGGHAAAAGFTVASENLEALRLRLNSVASVQQPDGGWRRMLRIDAETDLSQLNWKTYDELQRLGPHGQENPRPQFVARGAVVLSARRVGKAADGGPAPHLQLRVRDARKVTWECIAWRMGEFLAQAPVGAAIDLAFQLDVNEWNGERKLQLVVQDFERCVTAV